MHTLLAQAVARDMIQQWHRDAALRSLRPQRSRRRWRLRSPIVLERPRAPKTALQCR